MKGPHTSHNGSCSSGRDSDQQISSELDVVLDARLFVPKILLNQIFQYEITVHQIQGTWPNCREPGIAVWNGM